MKLVLDRKMGGNASAFCCDVVTEGVKRLFYYYTSSRRTYCLGVGWLVLC
jgi:hypothetical protein